VVLSDGRNYTDGDPTTGTSCPPTHVRRADTVSAIPGLHTAADSVYTVSIGDATTCGVTHDQLCPADNCNPNELDEYLLMDIVKGPPGDHTNAEDASTLPDIYYDLSQELIDICVSFSGHKYNDLGCDGPQAAAADPPLAGVDIVLLQGSTEVDRTASGTDGAYSFTNQQPQTYLICEDLSAFPGRTQSYPVSGGGTASHPPCGLCYERTLSTPGGSEGGLDFYNCPPATATPTPTSTETPVPPSATPTDTPVPPSATPTATPTSTLTPTRTYTPEATNTPRRHENTDTPTPRPTVTVTPLSQVSPAAVTPRATGTPRHEAEALPHAGSGGGNGPAGATAAGLVAVILSGMVLLEGMRLLRKRE